MIDEMLIKIDSEIIWICFKIDYKIKNIIVMNLSGAKHICRDFYFVLQV